MSLELLQQIRQAEEQAEAIRTEAARQAREMLKATEGACVQAERAAAVEHRGLYQQLMDAHRRQAEEELSRLARERAEQRRALCEDAETRVAGAAKHIFDSVVTGRSAADGHR